MKLGKKIAALLRVRQKSGVGRQDPLKRSATGRRRPAVTDLDSFARDMSILWEVTFTPADQAAQLLARYLEQLALEAYHNGEQFKFTLQELDARLTIWIERLIKQGLASRVERSTTEGERPGKSRTEWLEAERSHINRLADWWRLHGGPDIEPEVF